MNVIKTVIGGGAFLAGVWTLADLPIVNPLPAILLGWTLLGLGLAVFCPALLDLLGDGES
jgi:hypothetical protein